MAGINNSRMKMAQGIKKQPIKKGTIKRLLNLVERFSMKERVVLLILVVGLVWAIYWLQYRNTIITIIGLFIVLVIFGAVLTLFIIDHNFEVVDIIKVILV